MENCVLLDLQATLNSDIHGIVGFGIIRTVCDNKTVILYRQDYSGKVSKLKKCLDGCSS